MSIVDHESEIIGDLYHLNSSLNLGFLEGRRDFFCRASKMPCNRNRTEGIIYAELAGSSDLAVHIDKSSCIKEHTQFTGLSDVSKIDCSKIYTLIKTIGFNLAGMSL